MAGRDRDGADRRDAGSDEEVRWVGLSFGLAIVSVFFGSFGGAATTDVSLSVLLVNSLYAMFLSIPVALFVLAFVFAVVAGGPAGFVGFAVQIAGIRLGWDVPLGLGLTAAGVALIVGGSLFWRGRYVFDPLAGWIRDQ